MIAEDIAEIIHDPDGPASLCNVEAPDAEPRPVRMIARPSYGSVLDPRNRLLAWADTANMPRGADWGYGLMLAADAPEGMTETTSFSVVDGTGRRWRVEAARPVLETEQESGALRAVAWRLALRGTQRAVRGK